MTNDGLAIDDMLEIVGDLKDRLYELEQEKLARAVAPRLAPNTLPFEPWAPCTREEAMFYANLTDFH